LTRLETRTKERISHASQGAMQKTHRAQWKCILTAPNLGKKKEMAVSAGCAQWEHSKNLTAEPRWSMRGATREKVSCAGQERSQGKPWWRLFVVLTCKLPHMKPGTGAKDSSNFLVAGSGRNFSQDSMRLAHR